MLNFELTFIFLTLLYSQKKLLLNEYNLVNASTNTIQLQMQSILTSSSPSNTPTHTSSSSNNNNTAKLNTLKVNNTSNRRNSISNNSSTCNSNNSNDLDAFNKFTSYAGFRNNLNNAEHDDTQGSSQHLRSKLERYGSSAAQIASTNANIVFETKLKIIDILQVC